MTTTVATKTQSAIPTLRERLDSPAFREAVAHSLPKHLTADRFVRTALTAMTRTPKLAQCDQASFFAALMTLSQAGLEPDGRNAHLIPFENRKRGCIEVQLIIDYKGLVELAMRSGKIAAIHADKVCENDVFEFDRGELRKHVIDFKNPRGAAYAYYALIRFKDGMEKCEVMTRQEVDEIRKRSKASGSGPWVTDYDEMAKKSVFRRASKWLPLSPEHRDLLDAEDAGERHARSINVAPPTALDVSFPFSLPEPAPDAPAIDKPAADASANEGGASDA